MKKTNGTIVESLQTLLIADSDTALLERRARLAERLWGFVRPAAEAEVLEHDSIVAAAKEHPAEVAVYFIPITEGRKPKTGQMVLSDGKGGAVFVSVLPCDAPAPDDAIELR